MVVVNHDRAKIFLAFRGVSPDKPLEQGPRGIRALLCYVYFAEVDPLLQPFLFSGLKLANKSSQQRNKMRRKLPRIVRFYPAIGKRN